jgi:hypothetical protein
MADNNFLMNFRMPIHTFANDRQGHVKRLPGYSFSYLGFDLDRAQPNCQDETFFCRLFILLILKHQIDFSQTRVSLNNWSKERG